MKPETPFARRLDDGLVEALNRLVPDETSWWSRLVADPAVFIAVRDGYLNAYVYGGSMVKVGWAGGELVCETHAKYLPPPVSPYVRWTATTEVVARRYEEVKARILALSHDERRRVNALAARDMRVLDIEAAFGGSRLHRVDLVRLERSDTIVFDEAKLRSAFSIVECLGQIGRYRALLRSRDRQAEVFMAYSNVRRLWDRLDGSFFERRRSLPYPADVACEPRLVLL